MSSFYPVRKRDAASLAPGYSRAFRRVEILSILAFFGMLAGLVARLWNPAQRNPWLVLLALVSGYIAADFCSGVVHWLGDTWGSPDLPLLGATVIRPFREHHVDQTAIARHDFVETNGANCLISLPPAAASLILPLEGGQELGLFAATFLGSLILWVFGTNQFHKWAHLSTPPTWIATLQRWHLILPPDHHAIHHTAPFSRYYCITVGWWNWPLSKLGVFPFLEQLITSLTGALPRRDDIGDPAARWLLLEEHQEQSASALSVPALTDARCCAPSASPRRTLR